MAGCVSDKNMKSSSVFGVRSMKLLIQIPAEFWNSAGNRISAASFHFKPELSVFSLVNNLH